MQTLKKFYFYRRYLWNEDDFTDMQSNEYGFSQGLAVALAKQSVVSGFDYLGATGLSVGYDVGVAYGATGQLLAKDASGTVSVTNNVKSLIVIRPSQSDTNYITRPTSPFDSVPLNNEQIGTVMALAGDASNYPAKGANDVILFGVVASGGSIASTDKSKCEFWAKRNDADKVTPNTWLVGNRKYCDYLDLADAISAASAGDIIRVLDNIAVATTITANKVLEIRFDPGVTITKNGAATGMTISADRVRVKGGRWSGFSTAGNKAINITGNYAVIADAWFSTNDTNINDTNANSTTYGVIDE